MAEFRMQKIVRNGKVITQVVKNYTGQTFNMQSPARAIKPKFPMQLHDKQNKDQLINKNSAVVR